MGYKFAFDLGTTSLGWAVVEIDDNKNVKNLIDMGVRIFSDGREPDSSKTFCADRREKRSARRRHDRILQRKHKLLSILKDNGMDFEIDNRSPYKLRANSVNEKIDKSDLGRILFHICQRRGFKSNRKDLKKDSGGKLKSAINRLSDKLNGNTLGQYLYERLNNKGKARFTSDEEIKKSSKDSDFTYPTREMYEYEFNKIWEVQSKYYPELNNVLKDKIYKAIFDQRPLAPQERGKCAFEKDEYRIFKVSPLFQEFRVLQTVNNIRSYIDERHQKVEISKAQRDKLKNVLLTTFEGVNKDGKLNSSKIKSIMGLDKNSIIDLKTRVKKSKKEDQTIYSNTTAFLMSKPERFGQIWFELQEKQQTEIIDKLLSNDTDEDIKNFLYENYNLSDDQIDSILMAPIEESVGSLSAKAIEKIIPYLRDDLLYSEACEKAGYNHYDITDGGVLSKLPYYGEVLPESCIKNKKDNKNTSTIEEEQKYGHISNISVHIALNQLRLVVNSLIDKYGKPDMVAIETARELTAGEKERRRIERGQKDNYNKNEEVKEKLKTDFNIISPSRDDIQKYKLWEELSDNPLNRRCPYTLKMIGENELFSNQIEIEHILPFSKTGDDSMANKTLSYRSANQYKGNRSPYEAFHDQDNWDQIFENSLTLPKNKQWRFREDAMDKCKTLENRALNDTRHMTRISVRYLQILFEKDKKKGCVYGIPGKLTSIMREIWNLNYFKNKDDESTYRGNHIHHAIDAFVIACIGRFNLQLLADNADFIEKESSGYKDREEWIRKLILCRGRNFKPYADFNIKEFKDRTENVTISYKPNIKDPKTLNSTIGSLHEDSAYNLLDFAKDDKGNYTNDTKAIFVKCKNKKSIDFLRYIPIFKNKSDKKAYYKAYENWYINKDRYKGNERTQLLNILREKAKQAYKWFVGGANFCFDIYQINPNDKNKKEAGKWKSEVMSNYMATLNKGVPMWKKKYPTARLVMRLRQNDMVKAEFNINDIHDNLKSSYLKTDENGSFMNKFKNNQDTIEVILKVKKIAQAYNTIYFRPDFITRDENDTKSWPVTSLDNFIKHKIRKVYVSPIGEVFDNGFDNKWMKIDK